MPTNWPPVFNRTWFQLGLVIIIGLQAFFANIQSSLFGEMEGLYAKVTYYMMAGGDYINIQLPDGRYLNKPPFFFWTQAGMVDALGWSEAALRFPSALASLGTMIVTYLFGRLLFSAVAGFWAAIVVGTCYAGLWFGPLGIIDPVLTFFMTMGLYAWARAYFEDSSSWWYVVGFLALAFGTMVKTFHALALPALVFGVFLWIRRDPSPFRTRWFWTGMVGFAMIVTAYFYLLDDEFRNHLFIKENLQRIVGQRGDVEQSALSAYLGKRPIHWYGYTIWFDLFPWSVLMPVGLLLLWKRRPWLQAPREAWVWWWVVGYFLAFSLVPEKHERYLLPLVPAIGLVVGYLWHRTMEGAHNAIPDKPLRILVGLAGAAFVVLAFLGPVLLQKKWYVSLDIIPFPMQICLSILGIAIIGLAFRARLTNVLLGVGGLGLALMLTVTEYIIPGILANGSPRQVVQNIERTLKNPTDPILIFQTGFWRGDEDVFYMDSWHGHSRVVAKELPMDLAMKTLLQEVSLAQKLLVLMTEEQFQQVTRDLPELQSEVLMQFYRSKRKILFVSLSKRDVQALEGSPKGFCLVKQGGTRPCPDHLWLCGMDLRRALSPGRTLNANFLKSGRKCRHTSYGRNRFL